MTLTASSARFGVSSRIISLLLLSLLSLLLLSLAPRPATAQATYAPQV